MGEKIKAVGDSNLMRALLKALLIEIKNKTNGLNVQHPHPLQSHRK